jgi:hypothetical protein
LNDTSRDEVAAAVVPARASRVLGFIEAFAATGSRCVINTVCVLLEGRRLNESALFHAVKATIQRNHQMQSRLVGNSKELLLRLELLDNLSVDLSLLHVEIVDAVASFATTSGEGGHEKDSW